MWLESLWNFNLSFVAGEMRPMQVAQEGIRGGGGGGR